jgi:hypothetical protein
MRAPATLEAVKKQNEATAGDGDPLRVLGTGLHSPISQSSRPMKLAEQIR